jgi:hypothetical protein
MRQMAVVVLIAVGFLAETRAFGQNVPPFFGGGVVAYNPTISTVNSGAVFGATAVVSHDRKYVTIGGQAQQSNLVALRDFAVASGPAQGFVGGIDAGGGAVGGNGGGFAALPEATQSSPDQIHRNGIAAKSILSQRGMFFLSGN